MPPCEYGVCYSRLSKLKDWNQKWDAFLVVRDRAEDLRKVIALVQDGAKTRESREY